uniref:Uncharacterized protein n=1 Tax=Homalodisca liturata TaxID=320908 RepID=A0A1B6IPF4_9HEMI
MNFGTTTCADSVQSTQKPQNSLVDRSKLRKVVAAVFNLSGKGGVNMSKLRRYVGQQGGKSPERRKASRSALDSDDLENALEARRRRGKSRQKMTRRHSRSKGHSHKLEAQRRRRSGSRRRGRRRTFADFLGVKKQGRLQKPSSRKRSTGPPCKLMVALRRLFVDQRPSSKSIRRPRRRVRRMETPETIQNSIETSKPPSEQIE